MKIELILIILKPIYIPPLNSILTAIERSPFYVAMEKEKIKIEKKVLGKIFKNKKFIGEKAGLVTNHPPPAISNLSTPVGATLVHYSIIIFIHYSIIIFIITNHNFDFAMQAYYYAL